MITYLASTSIDFGMEHRAQLEAFAGQKLTSAMQCFSHIYGLENPFRAYKLNDGRILVMIELEIRSQDYIFADRQTFNAWYQEYLGYSPDPETNRRF